VAGLKTEFIMKKALRLSFKVFLFLPCLVADLITLPIQLILTKMNEDFSPYPFCQYLIES